MTHFYVEHFWTGDAWGWDVYCNDTRVYVHVYDQNTNAEEGRAHAARCIESPFLRSIWRRAARPRVNA